jgi:hypothetical protein
MAEWTSDDVSLAVALESDPLPPDAVVSGAEELPLVPSGPITPVSNLQPAASSNPDEPPSQAPSRTAHQSPTSEDGASVPEHHACVPAAAIIQNNKGGQLGLGSSNPELHL